MSDVVTEIARHRPPDPLSVDPFVIGPVSLARGPVDGVLSGLCFAVKDLYDVAGTRTGAGNPARLLDAPVALRHATIVQALIDAGAELVGKTVSDELALSLSGTNIHYGTPANPVARDRVPGGSSSGSVVAVASGQVDFSLGTDTGGSTRVPASYCGIFGLRVTHGRVSRDGVFLLAPSFCSIGVFARDSEILTKVWSVLAEASAEGPRAPRAQRSVSC
jgi:amidase